MERFDNLDEDIVELGSVTAETKGGPAPHIDTLGGVHPMGGISDD